MRQLIYYGISEILIKYIHKQNNQKSKSKLIINKIENVGLQHRNGFNVFIEYSRYTVYNYEILMNAVQIEI